MNTRWTSQLRRFVAARLSPEGQLGLHLTVGVALMLIAIVVFHEIAEAVMGAGQITVLDQQVAQWFNQHALPWLTSFLLVYTDLHGVLGALIWTALLAAYLPPARQLLVVHFIDLRAGRHDTQRPVKVGFRPHAAQL